MFSNKFIEDSQIKVLAIGPSEGLVTGQSIAFSTFTSQSRHNIDIININSTGENKLIRIWVTITTNLQAGIKIFLKEPPDIIYITTSRSKLGAIKDIIFLSLARLKGIPVINHLHGNSFNSFRESLNSTYKKLLDWAYHYIKLSIVLHEDFINTYDCYPLMKIKIVKNFVNSEIMEYSFKNKKENTPINILYLSNIVEEKGIFEVIKAVKNINDTYQKSFNLKIAGEFIEFNGVSKTSTKNKFNNLVSDCTAIEYIGKADMPTKIGLLDWSHIFVLPSYMQGEAIPLSILEAMAAGCYLIVSDYGSLPKLIDGLVGSVVKSREVLALENALLEVLSNKHLISKANKENSNFAKKNYTQEKYIADIDDIITMVFKEIKN